MEPSTEMNNVLSSKPEVELNFSNAPMSDGKVDLVYT